jgi:hypothetical protein
MPDEPDDPYGDDGWSTDDACLAVGISVLESFADGATSVMVTKKGSSYMIVDDTEDD